MATVGELVINLRGNSAHLTSTLDEGARKTRRFANDTQQGFRKIENAVVDLGLKVLGLDGKWARLAEGALLFGTGGFVTLAITGGLVLIGQAMGESSKRAQEHREEIEKLAKRYAELAKEIRLGARGMIVADLVKAKAELATVPASGRDVLNKNDFNSWKALFGWVFQGSPMKPSSKSPVALIEEELTTRRKAIQQVIDDINTVLNDFDTKAEERANRALPKNLLTSPLFQETRQAANRRVKELQERQDRFAGLDTGRIVKGITEDAEKAAATISTKLDPAITNLAHKVQLWRDITVEAAAESESALQRFFYGLQTRGLSSFRSFISEIIRLWQQMLARIAADQIGRAIGLNALIGGITGGLSGLGGGGVLPGPTPPPGIGGGISVNLTVNALDARGVREASTGLAREAARQVLEAVRTDSGFALALRGA